MSTQCMHVREASICLNCQFELLDQSLIYEYEVKIYQLIYQGLQQHTPLTIHDLAFFPLHIDVDDKHAASMRKILIELANSSVNRKIMIQSAYSFLQGREKFYDNLCESISDIMRFDSSTKNDFSPDTSTVVSHLKLEGQFRIYKNKVNNFSPDELYDGQSKDWVRTKSSCLSDFTVPPVLFDMCEPHAHGARVLDVGCGEGYCARKLTDLGSKFIVGTDMSKEKISRAKQAFKQQKGQLTKAGKFQAFLTGDATDLKKIILENFAEVHLLPQDIERGCFDLSIACFLFNYLSISDMNSVVDQISQLLVPGGYLIFSVLHPMLAFLIQTDDSSSKCHTSRNGKQYFSMKDISILETIKRLKDDDNVKELKVHMMYKTFSDYFNMLRRIGFEIVDMVEAGVKEENLKGNRVLFDSVNDLPLHLLFKVRKPFVIPSFSANHLPRKIIWDGLIKKENIVLHVSPDVQKELAEVTNFLVDRGVSADDFINIQHSVYKQEIEQD